MRAIEFPPTFSDTVTLFNRYYDAETRSTTWHRTVLKGCWFSRESSRTQEGATITYADVFNVRIPKSADYHPPLEWTPGDGFTLQPEDLIFNGNVDFEIDESTEGRRANDYFNKCKPEAFYVKSIKINTNAAGVLEHYRAMG